MASAPKQMNSTEITPERIGGYGEILFQQMNYGTDRYISPEGSTRDRRSEISLHRAVFALDYHLGKGWYLGTEIEFE